MGKVFLLLKQNKIGKEIMKKTLIFIIAIFLSLLAQSSFAVRIMNNNVSVRTMPSAFYPVLTILSKGAEVEILHEEDQWKKIKTADNKIGWISENAFNSIKKSIDYGAMSNDNSKKNMSKLMVTASVKGFFENKVTSSGINRDVFEKPFRRYINPSMFNKFKKQTYDQRWSHKKFRGKNKIEQKGAFTIDENLVALSSYIAAKFSAPGLSQNLELVVYVNNVAQLIIESTEFYDLPVSVLVVKSDEVFANATPIGVIVISEGLLKIMKDESELACLLGHEIAHVTLNHGSTEFEIRKPKFAAADAFSELEEELGVDEVEEELNDLCDEMYERAVGGRKAEYEEKADHRGMIYARRAGYSANGMLSLLKRLKSRVPVSREPTDASHWLPVSMQKRITKLENITATKLKPNKHYLTFQSRYKAQRK